MKTISQDQLRDYSSLFSRAEVMAWKKRRFNSINAKIIRYDSNWLEDNKNTYTEYIKYVYSVLENYYATEYIIKNNFLTEFLIPELREKNATIVNEFKLGKSVADLAVFNGTSKVFEIKTEYDSDKRLELQLDNYRKVFNEVYLIIPETKLIVYQKIDKEVGLISYNLKKKCKFSFIRESQINDKINPGAIMNILHTNEYKNIVYDYYGFLPHFTSFNQFEECRKLLIKIPLIELNKLFIDYMKKRFDLPELSNRYFKEFNQISLALKLSKTEKANLISNLKTSITL